MSLEGPFLALVLAAVGAFWHLDRVAVLQTLFHRPIFVAPLLGWLIGAPEVGVFVGLLCEFASLLIPPMGTDLPPDESSWATTSMVAFAAAGQPLPYLPLILALALVVIPWAGNVERWVREGNGRLAQYADEQALSGLHVPYKRLVLVSMLGRWLVFFGLFAIVGYGIALLMEWIAHASASVRTALMAVALYLITVIPASQVLRGATSENRTIWRGALWGLGAMLGLVGWIQ